MSRYREWTSSPGGRKASSRIGTMDAEVTIESDVFDMEPIVVSMHWTNCWILFRLISSRSRSRNFTSSRIGFTSSRWDESLDGSSTRSTFLVGVLLKYETVSSSSAKFQNRMYTNQAYPKYVCVHKSRVTRGKSYSEAIVWCLFELRLQFVSSIPQPVTGNAFCVPLMAILLLWTRRLLVTRTRDNTREADTFQLPRLPHDVCG